MPSSFAVESLRSMKLSMRLLMKSSCGDCIVAKHDSFHIVVMQDVKAVMFWASSIALGMLRPRTRAGSLSALSFFHHVGFGGVLLDALDALLAGFLGLVHLRRGDDFAVVGFQDEMAPRIGGLDHELSHTTAPFLLVGATIIHRQAIPIVPAQAIKPGVEDQPASP